MNDEKIFSVTILNRLIIYGNRPILNSMFLILSILTIKYFHLHTIFMYIWNIMKYMY